MILATSPSDTLRETIVVFGAGLVGAAVVQGLCREGWHAETLPLVWQPGSLQNEQLASLATLLSSRPAGSLRALWSAGSAGFGAGRDRVGEELASFGAVLEAWSELVKVRGTEQAQFVLISSAGGLFEGQRFVGPETAPRPLRPYGELKLAQESLLQASRTPMAKAIFRLTSVFGYLRTGQRRGLIPTLIASGLTQRIAHFQGRMTTLRDYVWIGDVARFLVRVLRSAPSDQAQPAILASGKPSSLWEIQRLVEQVLDRRLYAVYDPAAGNSQDITVSPACAPPGWYTCELQLALRQVVDDALNTGVLWGGVSRAS